MVTAGVVVVTEGTAGVVTVTVEGAVAPGVVPAEPVVPSDGAVLEQNGTPALGAVVAVEVVLVLDTGSVVALVLGDAGVVAKAEPPSPLPPSPGVPEAAAIADTGPRTAIATAPIDSSSVNLARGGCWHVPVRRSGGSGIPRFKRTLEPRILAQVAVRRIVIAGGSRALDMTRHVPRWPRPTTACPGQGG